MQVFRSTRYSVFSEEDGRYRIVSRDENGIDQLGEHWLTGEQARIFESKFRQMVGEQALTLIREALRGASYLAAVQPKSLAAFATLRTLPSTYALPQKKAA
jgi:hypothetical protein